ncbi:MAG: hypothetical protein M0R17_00330 [Candidatus Omnitrophica bacterium]|jgi:hypothetical protein|nr:hypothetical protein [Candidatus Omnitrophota bacterium]
MNDELDINESLNEEDNVIEDILSEIDLICPKRKAPKIAKKVKREYVNPVELREEILKHIFNKKINEDYVMDKKLAVMCMKIIDELFEKGNFRGYHSGWKYEMKSKAYENLIRYIHQYDSEFVEKPDFFINWIYRVHTQFIIDFFVSKDLSFDAFKDTLIDVKKRFIKKAKDPNKIIKDTYKKVTASDFSAFLSSKGLDYDVDKFKSYLFEMHPDLQEQFEEYKLRNAFNYVTMMVYRSAQHVIKNEKKNKEDNQRLDEAILYRTDDFDEDAIEQDNRYITFDENKLDYGGFEI